MLATSAIVAAPAPAKPSVTWNAGQKWNPRPLGAENRAAGAIAREEKGGYRGEQAQYFAQKTLAREILKSSKCPPSPLGPKGNGGDVDKSSFCYGTTQPCNLGWNDRTFPHTPAMMESCAKAPLANENFMTPAEFDLRNTCFFGDGYYPYSDLTAAWGDTAADRQWPANAKKVIDSAFERVDPNDDDKITRTEWCNTRSADTQYWCDWEYGLDYVTIGEKRCFDPNDQQNFDTWKKIIEIDVSSAQIDEIVPDKSDKEAWGAMIVFYIYVVKSDAAFKENKAGPSEYSDWPQEYSDMCLTPHEYALFWMDRECDVQQTIQDVEIDKFDIIPDRRALNAKTALPKGALALIKTKTKIVKNPRDASRQGHHI